MRSALSKELTVHHLDLDVGVLFLLARHEALDGVGVGFDDDVSAWGAAERSGARRSEARRSGTPAADVTSKGEGGG